MSGNREAAIKSYVTDMLSLEQHIAKAIQAQADDFEKDHPVVGQHLHEMHQMIEQHIVDLEALVEGKSAGTAVGEAIKEAGSVVAGWGAAAIDLIRHEKFPKNLRDAYTAFSLASVGYLMLYATASAFENDRIAQVAGRHLGDYATMLSTLLQLIPDAVVEFLRADGFAPRSEVVQEIHRGVAEAWRNHAVAI